MSLVQVMRRAAGFTVAIALFALLGPASAPPPAPDRADAASLPSGFREVVAFSGLDTPTAVRFSANGRVFVAEKSGLIKVFDSLTDPSPSVFADLSTNVYNFWDRGLLGLTIHPSFPSQPYVYALYSHDAVIGGQAPRFGTAGVLSDPCPTPPGATADGCVTSGRLSRLTAVASGGGYVMSGPEQVLVEDWCGQYQTHSVGTAAFGSDGALYASGGEGAGATFTDYGQFGNPRNPCGDPPGGVGATLTPPSAEGGALRSQDLRTSSDPAGLDGTIIRVDALTGAGLASNPFAGSSDANARRVIAYGLRNPFRFAFRPGTNEPWVADVGGIDWEEINRIANPADATAENFGWPCYEGAARQSSFDAADFTLCENLYGQAGAVTSPYFAYDHDAQVVAGESCPTGSSSVSGMAFEPNSAASVFPSAYRGALFFADYSRDCIWAMKTDGSGVPAPASLETFVSGATNPVHLDFGPDGNLYYVDIEGGTIRRVEVAPGTPPPTGTSYLSDLTWTSATNHCGPVELDRSFGGCLPGDGVTLKLNGVTFAKGLGAHADSDVSYFLGGTCTRFKASVGLDDEVPAANGSTTFQVFADAAKVFDSGVLNASSPTQAVDVSVSGASQLRLVASAGAEANWDHADWALARVECGASDTTPPTITDRTPDEGATEVLQPVSPTATFSEAMNASTITTSTFTVVKQGQTTPLAAAVSYASQVATLNPSADLEAGTTYIATVKGGTAGVKDVAGNALVSDSSWSFTTAAGANTPPTPVIDTPAAGTTWKVGDLIAFTGHASDPEQGTLPSSSLSWSLVIQHCPSTCHSHTIQSWPGVASGSFTTPDHEHPSYLELKLTATDVGGLATTTTLRLDPQTVVLSFASSPSGLQLAVNAATQATPFTRTVIVGSQNSVSAPSPQSLAGTSYLYSSWSDGGAQTHTLAAPATPATYTATYTASIAAPVNTALPSISGQARVGRALTASEGSWAGSQPIAFAYQWLRCTSTSLASCANLTGATAKTYIPTTADIGFRLRVRVIATNAGGSTTATSNSTSPVKR